MTETSYAKSHVLDDRHGLSPRKRKRSTTLTLTLPSALMAKVTASAKASVRTPQQQAAYILLRHYEMLDGQQLDRDI